MYLRVGQWSCLFMCFWRRHWYSVIISRANFIAFGSWIYMLFAINNMPSSRGDILKSQANILVTSLIIYKLFIVTFVSADLKISSLLHHTKVAEYRSQVALAPACAFQYIANFNISTAVKLILMTCSADTDPMDKTWETSFSRQCTVWVKKIPHEIFWHFSQTVGNFWSKFYKPIIRSYLR